MTSTSRPERLMTAALLIALGVAGVAVVLFTWLGREVVLGITLPIDIALRDQIHSLASPGLTRIMLAASRFGGPAWLVPIAILLALVFLLRGWHRGAVLVGITLAGAGFLDGLLKRSFGRARPESFFDYPLPASHSFPSGHALFSASLLGGFMVLISARVRSRLLRGLLWVLTICLILLVGFSRVYLGVHYPTDVIAGYAVAVVWITGISVGDRWASYRGRRETSQ
jgi:undecaprenyl-diphosphatase